MAILKIWDGTREVEIPIGDPTLYLLLDGSRAMAGALNMGANAITNATNVIATDYVRTPEVRVLAANLSLNVADAVADRTVVIKNTGGGGFRADLDVDRNIIVGGAAVYDAVHDNGDVNGNIVIDWTNGNVQKITLDGNVTQVLFTNPPGPCNCRLWIYQDNVGGHTIADNWDGDVKWGGTAPVVSADADNFDLGVFEYDGASTYAAQLAQGVDGLGFNPP